MKTWKEFTDPMPRIVIERGVALETVAGWVVVEAAVTDSADAANALAFIRRMADIPCEHFTSGDCITNNRVAFCGQGCDAACYPCIARWYKGLSS